MRASSQNSKEQRLDHKRGDCQNSGESLYYWPVQTDVFGQAKTVRAAQAQFLSIGSAQVQLHFMHHRRARRYVLRVRRDGSVRVTVPRGGTISFATEFARKHAPWIERQWRQ